MRRRYEKAEVKRFTRRARSRRLGWTIALAIVSVMAALVLTAVYSPILALRDVRVEGAASLDPVVVANAVSGQLGTPLALIDTARLESDLSQFPTIRSYVTELIPPGTLVIHIVERSPIGLVATASGFDSVDAAGVVLASSATRPAGLPLLVVDADGVSGQGFAAMSQVLIALPAAVSSQVDSVSAQTHDDVTLTLSDSAQRVVWGSADSSTRKAEVLAALLARFAGSGPGEYDVSAPGSAVFHAD
ncbi:FtsQ-type POTRA domain-containing protein [Pseudolysinimonas sp.]|uniref:FtsQ-type POTRA domain-containing protein n=1 Tax=Pseudolysinimonas sp. TaxID=2680009 RepID=UPI0032672749